MLKSNNHCDLCTETNELLDEALQTIEEMLEVLRTTVDIAKHYEKHMRYITQNVLLGSYAKRIIEEAYAIGEKSGVKLSVDDIMNKVNTNSNGGVQ